MGRCVALLDMTRELRDDLGTRADEVAGRMVRDHIEAMGYHPCASPRLQWVEVTEMEVAIETSVNGSAIMRPGDWHVRGVIEVREDAEIR